LPSFLPAVSSRGCLLNQAKYKFMMVNSIGRKSKSVKGRGYRSEIVRRKGGERENDESQIRNSDNGASDLTSDWTLYVVCLLEKWKWTHTLKFNDSIDFQVAEIISTLSEASKAAEPAKSVTKSPALLDASDTISFEVGLANGFLLAQIDFILKCLILLL